MTTIALPARRIPPIENTNEISQEFAIIVSISQERATELLKLMGDITTKTQSDSSTYRICSFEPETLVIRSRLLVPDPNDFRILANGFLDGVDEQKTVPIFYTDASVFPYAVSWTAVTLNEEFQITSIEIDMGVLLLIADGKTFPDGSTRQTVESLSTQLAEERNALICDEKWIN